jgi:thiosulfate/3-mercaptopyruvate sulfurtransferase
MVFRPLITTSELYDRSENGASLVFDCRFSLNDTERGRSAYATSHIPGAFYLHLDEDLSGPVSTDRTGRHPLPDPERFAERMSRFGVNPRTRVFVYDDMGGAIAARLWWMLRWLGHETVAVLDGGWQAWCAEGHRVSTEIPVPSSGAFVPKPDPDATVTAEALSEDPDLRILDARGPERYRGDSEPIDPVAGHIPGAVSAPFKANLDETGHFHSIPDLKNHYLPILDGAPMEKVIVYCGSGVTAAHNILAMDHAGLGRAKLYPGSWSEWITDPDRPVVRGESP